MRLLTGLAVLLCLFIIPEEAAAMHIMEGFLPMGWAGFWSIIMLPFLILGIRYINRLVKENPKTILLVAFAGAFTFVMSALKLPSITGSSSHATGMGLGTILFGPTIMVVIGLIVLVFQAVLLAHGGLTTLGANVFSMAIVGPFVTYGFYIVLKKLGAPRWASIFFGAAIGSFATYMVTALQLALAHPSEVGGIYASWIKFVGVFGLTQIPISIIEGILTVMVLNLLYTYSKQEIEGLNIS
ncbi:energy-coupling factor ABC transporter permease [Desulfitibacter alkalitolerans]|uniref:energy-coupling factor ABC transporter permease n=1 Tax=Desulfitibacter alkalitolerans TaxID=264641 RepID=UPI00047F3EF4|nr:energy-coupling factor ABC transporter permease [Desulfitibacter alkalitolerans]